jgi:hypothetical protein
LSAKAKATEAVKNLEAAAKDPPAYGERDVVKAGDGTGEVSSGWWSTATVTAGIS